MEQFYSFQHQIFQLQGNQQTHNLNFCILSNKSSLSQEEFLLDISAAINSSQEATGAFVSSAFSLTSDLFSIKLNDVAKYLLFKLRFMFYFVWPSETMFSSLDEVPRYVTEMFPIFFLVAILENIIRLFQGRNSLRMNETIGSLSQGIFQECLRIKVRSFEVIMYCLIYKNFRLLTLPWDSLWTWWLCYLSVDFGFYLAHRLAHEVNFIWAIHQAHHSSEEFSIVSALRQAVLQPFTAWFTYVPLALAIPPQIFLAHLQLSELYMAWLHTEVIDSIGPLEYILNTPSHHRVHHSRNPDYIDKNYGGMLIIWDRLFNTFKAEDKFNNPPAYGLVHQVKSFNPLWVQFHTWPPIYRRIKQAQSIQDKLGVIFYGPGWRPGLKRRLGNPEEIPKVKYPIEYYDPPLKFWLNGYILIHFTILIFFYHQITLNHNKFSPIITNIGVLSLLASITSLGIVMDNKRRYCNLYELIRCSLFFVARHKINYIVANAFQQLGFSLNLINLLVATLHLLFCLSIIANAIILLSRYLFINENSKTAPYWQQRKVVTYEKDQK